ncbi:MAG: 3-oxoacyl-acyl-carrier-protein synthase II [Nitrospirae bacterium]|nr:MAG: 3-oxoacyl-acyl-carrier-protein synthase II [Nitrospirota bacterium]
MKRVIVTGIGAVSPLGNSFAASWEAAKKGVSGIAPVTRFDASGIKWKVAGELKGFDASQYLSQKEIFHLDPFVRYAVAASVMAVEDAGLRAMSNEQRATSTGYLNAGGVIIGSSRGGISTIENGLNRSNRSNRKLSPYLMPSTSIGMAASYVAQKLGIRGYTLGISNACASGANAIGEAYRLIKSGYAGTVLAGGAEAPVCRFCMEGYGVSGALSRINDSSASRPFDRTRDGFVLAEGACVLVLEDYEAALKRGAQIYGEIIGYGNTTDAFHQTRPSPEGEARAISAAVKEAGIKIEDIDYISAHATSTPLGDKAETEAIQIAFGKKAYEIPVSSVKSMSGHMLSASGAFEAAITLMSMKEGVIAPAINLKEKDTECNLNYVTEIKKAEIKTAVSNSFGFGGVNAVLVFRRV